MTADTTARFEAASRDLDVDVTRTTADGFAETLADVSTEPAVGSSLPFADVSLADAPVTTEPSPRELKSATTGVTPALFAIADYGSVVVPGTERGDEPVSVYVDHHVVVVAESDVVPDMETAFAEFADQFSTGAQSAIVATGPSATADMGALVKGAHGPRSVHVVLLTDR